MEISAKKRKLAEFGMPDLEHGQVLRTSGLAEIPNPKPEIESVLVETAAFALFA
ncbi:MAG: hypothetical protein HY842_02250 [Bacteroidetes bacterium]|nr:hypothetical protein [Bacteroidota bacterium]